MLGSITQGALIVLAVVFLLWRPGADSPPNLIVMGILFTGAAWWLSRQQRDRFP